MALYFKDIEITNIDNLVPQTGLDITDLWFGSTNVYTVWQVYEGTLPATINANGANMRQYQVYGANGGVGDDSGTAYGYVIPMNVRSLNIYNSAETSWSSDGTVLNDAGEPIYLEGSHYTTNFIPVEPGEAYYLAGSLANETRWRVYFYDSNKNWIRRTGSKSPRGTRLIAMDENASYFQLQVGTDIVSTADWNFVHSLTAPEKYQPYSNTTTPIYIGGEPLEKVGDYADCVDYQKQKVVREIKKYVFNGTENWEQVLGAGEDSTKNYFRFTLSLATYLNANFSRCSHFTWQWINTSTTAVGFRTYIPTGSNVILLVVRPENVADMDLSDFKSWLAEQYAAGTPVTLWCALTTAEETDPPVPLPALPTCEGTTIVNFSGSGTAPEKVLLKYRKEGF